MLTFDDKGGWGGQKPQKPAYVIHGCSLIQAKIRGEEEDWQLWETVDTNRTKATNLSVQRGKAYQFRVIAINKAGKSDPSHPSRSKEAQPTSRKL